MICFVSKQVLSLYLLALCVSNQSYISSALASGHVHHTGHEVSDQDQQAVPEKKKGLVHQRSHGQGFGLECVTHLYFVQFSIIWLICDVSFSKNGFLHVPISCGLSTQSQSSRHQQCRERYLWIRDSRPHGSGSGPCVKIVWLPGPTSSASWSFVRSHPMLQRLQRNFFAHGGQHSHGNHHVFLSSRSLFTLLQVLQ